MIIKTIRCKHKSDIGRLVDYVLSDKGRIEEISDTFYVAQNIYGRDAEVFKKAFYENDKYRKKRKNGVILYHEVLSWESWEGITLNVMEDMTKKYIQLRTNGEAVVLAKPHMEEEHPHVHILISANAVKSKKKTMRIDNEKFMRIRRETERYELANYPHIKHSKVFIENKNRKRMIKEKQDKNKRRELGFQAKKRMGKGSKLDKEKLRTAILKMLDYSENKEDFMQFLKQEKLELYLYRNKINGVVYNQRKYRFSTLGIPKKRILELEYGKNSFEVTKILKQENEQDILILKYQEQLLAVQQIEENQQVKKIRVLVQNILDKSLSYKQFIFLSRKVGFYAYKKQGVIKGFSFNYKEYSFGTLKVFEQVARLRSLQNQRAAKKKLKEQNIRNRNIAIDLSLDIGLDFMI